MIYNMDASVADPAQWSQENKQLHLFICACAEAQLITKMMQKVLDHWDRLRLHYLQDVSAHRIKLAQQEHKQILEAFRSRDPDEVERVIRGDGLKPYNDAPTETVNYGYIGHPLAVYRKWRD
jgi:DNA-binding GntR family transcriptional regulator